MKPSVLYRIVAVLLALWAIGHTLGFRQTDPKWRVDSLVASMKSIHFDAGGFSRTYWDFFVGFGLFASVLLLFVAVLTWQLGGMSRETLKLMSRVTWTLAICFGGLTVLSWIYFFLLPVIFSAVITLCLILAAWLAGKPERPKA